jgi:hypothetical protein
MIRSTAVILVALAMFTATLFPSQSADAAQVTVVHSFPVDRDADENHPDGTSPDSLIEGPDGVLYGTTHNGGGVSCPDNRAGCGVVFSLTPSGTTYSEKALYRFRGAPEDGAFPIGNLVLGAGGTIYGTTQEGGSGDWGTAYKLTPSGKTYTETILYSFQGGADGGYPGGLLADASGDLFGTTALNISAPGHGTAFELTPTGSGFAEKTIYTFTDPDGYPDGSLVFGPGGAMYGSSVGGGKYNYGTVFALAPSQGGFAETTVANFHFYDGVGPASNLSFDKAGNIYGTTAFGGRCFGNPCRNSVGVAFKLRAMPSGYSPAAIYMFKREGDAQTPVSPLVFAAGGALYGTTMFSNGEATPYGALFRLQQSGEGYVESLPLLFPKAILVPTRSSPSCLIMSREGNLFGTAFGAVFKITL